MKTKIVIKVYDMTWITEGVDRKIVKKLPQEIIFSPDLEEFETQLADCNMDMDDFVRDNLRGKYPEYEANNFTWVFI